MKKLVAVLVLVIVVSAGGWVLYQRGKADPIRVGVIYSLSGTMAVSEKPLVDAVRLAVAEINEAGGIMGRPLEVIVADGRSDPKTAAAEAGKLITREKVSVLAACWTSACRQAVKPVVERHDHLMLYALQYEGMETSPNIIYAGSAPNQQIIPGTQWMLENTGKRVYLVGSDYVFPRTANAIIREVTNSRDGVVLGERYLPLGATDVSAVVDDIRRLNPDAVFNTINGDTNLHLFRALRQAGMQNTPLMSFSVSESEMTAMEGHALTAHYAAWSYFQEIKRDENSRFVKAFKAKFGADRVTSDPVEAAYTSMHIWARGVVDAHSDRPDRVARTILRQAFNAPSGVTAVDRTTRHLWKMARVGKVRPDGLFEEIWNSGYPLRPAPFPGFKSKAEWLGIVAGKGHGEAP